MVSHSIVFASQSIMFEVVNIIVNTIVHYIIYNKRDHEKFEMRLNTFEGKAY